jgi:hypothetical protein
MDLKREKWTEAEVINLPVGEHDYFDRKSGALLANMSNFQTKFAKALSAMANSGGGHIIFGQEDDGTITGVSPRIGRTPMREWLEQKVPFLVAYSLESFRVHQVIRETASSAIPADKELFVIDVGESRLAPHQTNFPPDNPQYFYRQGGKSIAAPHHYLEALRNRLTFAVLQAKLDRVQVIRAWSDGEHFAVLEIVLRFTVKNVSLVACYKWAIGLQVRGDVSEFIRTAAEFSQLGSGLTVNRDTILPTLDTTDVQVIGFRVNLKESLSRQVQENWPKIILASYAISENHISAETETRIADVPLDHPLLERMKVMLTNSSLAFVP